MRRKIVAITSQYLKEPVSQIVSELKLNCDIQVVPTTNLTQYQKFTILTPGTLTDFLSVVRSQKLPLSQLRTLITVRSYPLKLIQPACTVLF